MLRDQVRKTIVDWLGLAYTGPDGRDPRPDMSKANPDYYDEQDVARLTDAIMGRIDADTKRSDNHHNAVDCPYCNPHGHVLIDPRYISDRED